MPLTSDIILDWIHENGYSLSETGWRQARDRKFYFVVTAEKDGHQHIARALSRESAVVHLGMLIGYPESDSAVSADSQEIHCGSAFYDGTFRY